MDVDIFKKIPIMGILRGVRLKAMDALIETIISSGMKTIEITMNTPDAVKSIKRVIALSKGQLIVGAGTVLSLEAMHAALDAGASFIVMPILIQDVAIYCSRHGIPFFPGALTPQEVYKAYSSGATMVKVFPAGLFGPKYFKDLKGPFDNIELMAVGGVKLNNIKEYFDCKATAVAIGSSVFNLKNIHDCRLRPIRDTLSNFVSMVRNSGS